MICAKNCIFDKIITAIVETISEKAEVFAAGLFADNEIDKQAFLDRMNTVVKKQCGLMLAADRELSEYFDERFSSGADIEYFFETATYALIDKLLKDTDNEDAIKLSKLEKYGILLDRETAKDMIKRTLKVKIGMEAVQRNKIGSNIIQSLSNILCFSPTCPEMRLIMNTAGASLTLPETQLELNKKGYTGIKKYLYIGVVELVKLFVNSSKIFALMHKNASEFQFRKRMQRTDTVKALSIGIPALAILPVMIAGAPVAGLFYLPAVALGGVIWHALSNYMEDRKARVGNKRFELFSEAYLDDKIENYSYANNNSKVMGKIQEAEKDLKDLKAHAAQIKDLFEHPAYYENGLIFKFKTERYMEYIFLTLIHLQQDTFSREDLFSVIEDILGGNTASNFMHRYAVGYIEQYLRKIPYAQKDNTGKLERYVQMLEYYLALNGDILSKGQDIDEDESNYRTRILYLTSRTLISLITKLYEDEDPMVHVDNLFERFVVNKDQGITTAQVFTESYISSFGYIPDSLLLQYFDRQQLNSLNISRMRSKTLGAFLKNAKEHGFPEEIISLFITTSAAKDEVYDIIEDESQPAYFRLSALKAVLSMPYEVHRIKSLLSMMEEGNMYVHDSELLKFSAEADELLRDNIRERLTELSTELLTNIQNSKVNIEHKDQFIKSLEFNIILTAGLLDAGKEISDSKISDAFKTLDFIIGDKQSIEVSVDKKSITVPTNNSEKYVRSVKDIARKMIYSFATKQLFSS